MKCEFLEFTAGRFGKKEVDNARSVAFSRAGWKIPAIINLRGRVEGYVRNPPLENSSWPAGLKSHPLPPPIRPVKSRERNPPPRLPLTLQRTNLLFPGKNDGHIVKSFYVVNFTRHRHTYIILASQSETIFQFYRMIDTSDPRTLDYSSNLFPICRAIFENISI